ncbi:MAG: calcium-binding protein, partial [Candidatus Sedimenticola sp. (ex Thyasira tokunagai)]
MDSNIKAYFDLSSLAEASYIHFNEAIKDQVAIKDAILANNTYGGEFSNTQADVFLANWEFIHQQEDTESGFSATLFKSKDPSVTQPYVLSIRGTQQGKEDLVITDGADIVLDGLAIDQIVDLYNYWEKITTPLNESYEAVKLVTLEAETAALALLKLGASFIPSFNMSATAFRVYLSSRTDIIIDNGPDGLLGERVRTIESANKALNDIDAFGVGILNSSDLSSVTGHSLGGHLAVAFTRLFDDINIDAVTINGAGFATGIIPGLGLDAGVNIRNLFYMLGGADTFTPSRINNLFGDRYPEFVTQNGGLGLFQQGAHRAVYIEHSSVFGDNANLLGHGKEQMTNSLAVYNLLFQLDDSTSSDPIETVMEKYLSLFYTATPDDLNGNPIFSGANATLETVVNQLAQLFSIDLRIDKSQIDNREALFNTILAIQESSPFINAVQINLKITPLSNINIDGYVTELSASDISAEANADTSDGLAYRYALKHLNPFVILGDETIYKSHKNNGTLDLYDPVNNPNGMTPDYIADRTAMLSIHLQKNIADSRIATAEGFAPSTWTDLGSSGVQFTNNQLFDGLLNGKLHKTVNEQYIFGSDNADILKGGSMGDRLYGGSGNDILHGDGGNDYLEGGQGLDLYHTGNGDTLFDSDGEGMVFLENRVLTGGFRQDGDPVNLYRSDDGLVTYQLNGDTLTVSTATETLTIKNFDKENADLGIFIDDITVSGGILNLNNEDNYAPGRWEKDGEIIALFDGYDGVNGMGGNDTIFIGSHRTSFVIRGGAGDDSLFEDEQNPQGLPNSPGNGSLIFGEGGKDKIFGFNRSNFLDGGEQSDYIDGGGGNDTLLGGSGGDIVIGGTGKDTAYGGEGQDELSGGAGDDRIWGGDNNDVIYGDRSSGSLLEWIDRSVWNGPHNGWQEGHYIYNSGDGFSHNILQSVMDGSNYVYNEARGAEAGNDIIFGDSGDDFIIGGEGKDYINGGIGRDLLEGEAGEDKIYGGSDDDIIYGDINPNSYANDTAVLANGNKIGDQTWAVSWRLDIAGAGYSNIYSNDPEAQIVSVSNGYVNFTTGATFFNPSNWTLQARYTPNGPEAGGNDKLYGEGGSDKLHGGVGDDILDGGDGGDIDVLIGGKDNDSYHFGRGYGIDVLWDEQGDTDAIKLGEDISSEDVVLEKMGQDLLIKLLYNGSTTEDQLIASGWYSGYQVETIEFNDGTTWTTTDIEQRSNVTATPSGGTEKNTTLIIGGNIADTLSGTNEADTIYAFDGDDLVTGATGDDHLTGGRGNDELQGNDGNDTLLGDAGEDSLYGGAGNDYLHGGANSDRLFGGDGNDTYRIGRGDGFDYLDDSSGTDTVEFFGDISQSDIKLTATGEGIDITLNDESSHLHINGASLNTSLVIENIQFGDGTAWDADEIRQRLSHKIGTEGDDHIDAISQSDNHLEGLDGNDQLVGLSGNDLLEGGDGEDTLIGGGGDDRLIGGLGNDNYIVGDQDQTGHVIIEDNGQFDELNIVKFEPGIIPSQLSAQQMNDDLLISWGVADSDMTIKCYFLDPQAWQFELGSGAALDVDRLINPQTAVNDVLVLKNAWMDFLEISYAGLVAKAEEKKTSRYGIDSPLNHNVELTYNSNNSQQSNFELIQTEEGWYVLTTPGNTANGLNSWGFERSYPQGRGDGEVKITDFDLKTLGQFTPLRASTYNMNYHDGELVLSPRLIDTPYTYSQYNTQYTTITRLATDILYGDEIGSGSGLIVRVPIGLSTYNLQRILGTEKSDIIDIPASGPIFPAPAMIDGHEGDDQLIGDDADDMIYGSEGDDYIVGGYGDDHLAGGAGSDALRGGMGNDTYYAGFDHAGIDHIEDDGLFVNSVIGYLVQYGLPKNIQSEYPDFIGNEEGEGEGSSFNEEIVMEYLKNASEDEMAGIISQMQNDGWGWEVPSMINDVIKINADLSDISMSWTVEEGSGRLLLNINPKDTGDRGIVVSLRQLGRDVLGYGVELFEFNDGVISRDDLIQMMPAPMQGGDGDDLLRGGDGDDLLFGGWGNDRLFGKEGNDVLFGGEDDDRLNGGVGADRMTGGAGNDTYSVDNLGDTVTELADEGLDRIYSSIDYQLGVNQEQLTLTGEAHLNGTGNTLDN